MSEATVTALEHASVPAIIGTGLLMGIVHVLTGPDHLSALIVLSAGSSWRSAQLGMRWGCGHSTGLIVVTAAFLALNQQLDVETFGSYCDFMVGFLMIGLGLWSLRHYLILRTNVQQNAAKDVEDPKAATDSPSAALETTPLRAAELEHVIHDHGLNTHGHSHDTLPKTCCFGRCEADIKDPTTQKLTAFAYGTMHGLAGTGGILGVLPAVILNDWAKSSAYLLSFCLASILIMGAFAAMYGEITGRMSRFSDTSLYRIGIFSSCVSLTVGILWVILVSTGTLDEVFG
uniref:Urease accessory protein UreH-like transmembrane domain-containing protein n=1 Tax=Globisporangium ultimum (strain ATCC 200006 / CBS 805.95 / DAOM BR144) TaxID=431595 RepID=K3X5J2_GLOUD